MRQCSAPFEVLSNILFAQPVALRSLLLNQKRLAESCPKCRNGGSLAFMRMITKQHQAKTNYTTVNRLLHGKSCDPCAIVACHYRKSCAAEKQASILMVLTTYASRRGFVTETLIFIRQGL